MQRNRIPQGVIERRDWGRFELRSDGQRPRIVGHGAVFDEETSLGAGASEIVRRGAFERTLRERKDIKALVGHSDHPADVIGSTAAGTLALVEDESGLAYTIDPPDTSSARDLVEVMRRGDVTGSSFGFIVTRQEPEKWDGRGLRQILEVDLWEISVVTFPAYAGAESQIRSLLGSRGIAGIRQAAGLLRVLRGEGLTDRDLADLLHDTSSRLDDELRAATAARDATKARLDALGA